MLAADDAQLPASGVVAAGARAVGVGSTVSMSSPAGAVALAVRAATGVFGAGIRNPNTPSEALFAGGRFFAADTRAVLPAPARRPRSAAVV